MQCIHQAGIPRGMLARVCSLTNSVLQTLLVIPAFFSLSFPFTNQHTCRRVSPKIPGWQRIRTPPGASCMSPHHGALCNPTQDGLLPVPPVKQSLCSIVSHTTRAEVHIGTWAQPNPKSPALSSQADYSDSSETQLITSKPR